MENTRESVFVSSLRSFCRMFFGICGITLALFLIIWGYSELSSVGSIDSKTTMNYLSDANNKQAVVSLSSPVILQLNIHGVIGEPKTLDSDTVQSILLESRTGLLASNRVKGILIHFNTPGGTVVDSDNIYRMLKVYKEKYKVPVYAYVDGLCASGGMYIACAADRIYSGPSGTIGSIGTLIGPFFNFHEALLKIGITSETITKGLDKDMMSPFRPWKPDEDASLKNLIAYFYQRFVDIVADARPRMDKTKLVQEYGAQIYDPVKAEELGYIDVANSSRNAALLDLLHEAKIDPSKDYQVVDLEPKSALLSLFTSQSPLFTGKIAHSLDAGSHYSYLQGQFCYLYQP